MGIKSISLAISALVLSANVNAVSILLSESSYFGTGVDVLGRLEGLGHSVTVSNASNWGAAFDYSIYDVVAFEYESSNPLDITNFIDAVDSNQVGAVFFRGYGAESTANALGLTNSTNLNYQSPATLNVLDNSHYITSGLNLGDNSLGYTYMSYTSNPGSNTTTLGTGSAGASLVVHNSRRAVLTPFYGHSLNFDNETQIGLDITQRSIEWAAGVSAVPVPAAVWLFGSGLIGLIGVARRKKT